MWYLILWAAFAVWVLCDNIHRNLRGASVLWFIGTVLLGPLVLPLYLAWRPLKQGETREGGTSWNVLKNFAVLWTALMCVAAFQILVQLSKHASESDTATARMGAGLGVIVGLSFLTFVWLVPTLGAAVLGFLLKKNTVVENGPTGALVGTDGVAAALSGFQGLLGTAIVAIVINLGWLGAESRIGSAKGWSGSGLEHKSENTALRAWALSESTNAIDGTRDLTLRLDSEDEIDGLLSKRRPYIALQCKGGIPQVVINIGRPIQHQSGSSYYYGVRLRIDGAPPSRQRWLGSTDHVALFSPAPVGLLRQLTKAQTLLFEYTPFQESERTIKFKVAGLGEKVKPVAAVCGVRI